ncbi:hypothetical protein [Pseudoalteromonas rhizosphaerae]|jgi:hypothetical protein|uniref:hypothetical protein n=1 Tax=Pseudoalteromonas rhizosphaerae TaxID=2518973 RepID=UPI003704C970
MAVITKKDEKISNVACELDEGFSSDDFVKKFQEQYPKDWGKIEREYAKHERKTKSGKTHPMPEPIQYLKNALNIWFKKNK